LIDFYCSNLPLGISLNLSESLMYNQGFFNLFCSEIFGWDSLEIYILKQASQPLSFGNFSSRNGLDLKELHLFFILNVY